MYTTIKTTLLSYLPVRDKQGIQKLALDINDGTLKRNFLEKLVKSYPDIKSSTDKISINFDMREYGVACDQLKEEELENEREEGGRQPLAPVIPASVSTDNERRAASADLTPASSGFYSREARSTPLPGRSPADGISSVISGILFTMVAKKDYFSYDFESQLKKLLTHKPHVRDVYNEDGLSLLHAIVISVRPTFFNILFRNGHWPDLIYLNVERDKNAQWGGLSAKEICEKRGRSRKLLADINYFSAWEKSLQDIHKAARAGNEEKVKRLMHKGESMECKDNAGATPLYWAVVSGTASLVEYLIAKGADTGVVTDRGETLLHIATSVGHPQIVKILLKKQSGLDPLIPDTYKKTAWDRNGERGDIETLKVSSIDASQ